MTGNIATDYEFVKKTISTMDTDLDEILSLTRILESTIENTRGWSGVDALEYKNATKRHINKLQRSARMLSALNVIISTQSKFLYMRAVKDQSVSEFNG